MPFNVLITNDLLKDMIVTIILLKVTKHRFYDKTKKQGK
jgi:hypothetical protein